MAEANETNNKGNTKKKIGMLDYQGTYRVIQEFDSNCKFTDNEHDNYVPCKLGIQLYRYSDDVLAIYFPLDKCATAMNVYQAFKEYCTEDFVKRIESEISSNITKSCPEGRLDKSERIILFYEKYLEHFVKELRPSQKGKKLSPTSKKHLPNYEEYEIQNTKKHEELKELVSKHIKSETGGKLSPYMYAKVYDIINDNLDYDVYEVANEEEIKFMEVLDFKKDYSKAIKIMKEIVIK